jgi:hypothetical protein
MPAKQIVKPTTEKLADSKNRHNEGTGKVWLGD